MAEHKKKDVMLERWKNLVGEDFRAGMMVTAVIAPALATAITLVIAIRHWVGTGNGWALLLGVVGGLIGWLICAAIAKNFVAIHSANTAVYRNLCSRFHILDAQMEKVEKRLGACPRISIIGLCILVWHVDLCVQMRSCLCH